MEKKIAINLAVEALREKRRRVAPQKAMYDDMQLPYHKKYSDEYEQYCEAITILEGLL
jgi:hypothetical protein